MPRKHTLTVEEIIKRREELASLDLEQLRKLSRDGLRERCAGCLDITSKDKKEDLVQKIWAWTEPIRLEKLAAVEAIKKELNKSHASISEDDIKEIVQKVNPKAAAQVLKDRMDLQLYSPTTIVKTFTPRIIKLVNSMENLDDDYKKAFAIALRYENKEDTKKINTTYKQETVISYANERRIINFDWAIDWALEQLIQRRNWKLVTLALTLTSGRRPVEIHCTGQFEITDQPNPYIPNYPIIKGWLSFSGQAKEKEDMKYKEAVGTYVIPTLVDSELWMEGYKWLVEKEKIGISKDKLNKTYAGEVSPVVKVELSKNGLNKWYDCRDFYGAAFRSCHAQMEAQNSIEHKRISSDAVISRLMGHSPKDIATQQSYAKLAIEF